MENASVRCVRLNCLRFALLCGVLAALAMFPAIAMGDGTNPVMKIEEDWEMVVLEPSPDITAPQITCLISPVGNIDGVYAALELNHGSMPDFISGGLQLQAWNGESWITVRDYADTTLQNNNEVVTWTTKMWLNNLASERLTFKVTNGTSTSWGAFGEEGNFKLSLTSAIADLSAYSPTVSVANSGIGFGAQRVQRLVLKQVRYYDGWGNLLNTDTTERVVHEQ
jgi:hypothetical protein